MSRLPTVHTSGAWISENERFRTRLWRIWGERPRLMFVGLNPSIAGPEVNDPTVEWLMTWANEHSFGGLEVGNLYGYRATDPNDLKLAGYPIGPGNDQTLIAVAKAVDAEGGAVVCGWGANAPVGRASIITTALEVAGVSLYRWGTNKNGSPKHPLYLPQATPLEQWSTFA